jgi:hypothetical protein
MSQGRSEPTKSAAIPGWRALPACPPRHAGSRPRLALVPEDVTLAAAATLRCSFYALLHKKPQVKCPPITAQIHTEEHPRHRMHTPRLQRRRLNPLFLRKCRTTPYKISYKGKRNYVQADVRPLVCSMQVDENVDARDKHFGENENDDNPFEELALCLVSKVSM